MTDKYNTEQLIGLDRYAVVGNPISHSKSPLIHEAFARQTNQELSYERILAPLDGFEATIRQLIDKGYKGVNVTVPFKFEAFKFATQHSNRAINAGAANTLSFTNEICADNTDGTGIIKDIEKNLKIKCDAKRVLLLGAGGAAEGVLYSILEAKPTLLVIANRTLDKALNMVKKVKIQQSYEITSLAGSTFEDLKSQQFDIIINATSAGLTNTALPIANTIFANGSLAYDMMYGRETAFMKQARENGALVSDGLGMLVEQAAEAFYIWRRVRPETQSVMQLIRSLTKS